MARKSDGKKDSDNPNDKTICTNRKARHEYEILDSLECGVVLKGSEVKSLRDGKVSLDEAYARVRENELWLVGCDIAVYPQASILNHEPKRSRKLLLHRREMQKFVEQANQMTKKSVSIYLEGKSLKLDSKTLLSWLKIAPTAGSSGLDIQIIQPRVGSGARIPLRDRPPN